MKKILITGAAGGLGKAIARILKNEKLLLIDNDEKRLSKVAKSLGCEKCVCDISDINQINELRSFVEKNWGTIDVLINCAGQWNKGELSQLGQEHIAELNSLERIKYVLDTNTFGTIAMTTVFAPLMIEKGKGQIVNINSQSGVEREEFCPVYNTSKHAGYAYRQAVQRDLAKHNIRITDICPGLMKTELFENANDALPKEVMSVQALKSEDVAKAVKYVLDLPHEITIPSLEIRHIKNY